VCDFLLLTGTFHLHFSSGSVRSVLIDGVLPINFPLSPSRIGFILELCLISRTLALGASLVYIYPCIYMGASGDLCICVCVSARV